MTTEAWVFLAFWAGWIAGAWFGAWRAKKRIARAMGGVLASWMLTKILKGVQYPGARIQIVDKEGEILAEEEAPPDVTRH